MDFRQSCSTDLQEETLVAEKIMQTVLQKWPIIQVGCLRSASRAAPPPFGCTSRIPAHLNVSAAMEAVTARVTT